jgi:ABC-2 type transport system ATP-binding protein
MIEIEHLSKDFCLREAGEGFAARLKAIIRPRWRVIHAVEDVSLKVEAGEIVGYLGPNGAGKSTTIKLLTGILHPTSGTVLVNGIVPQKNRAQNACNIGVVFGQRSQLSWDLPVIDTFEFLGAMYRVPQARYRSNLAFLVELLEIQPFLHQPVRKLSLGQRMRADLAAALLHEPPVLFLDEPTLGMDVLSKNRLLRLLQTLNVEKGVTILLTTHNLSDVEQVCPRILILDHGKIALDAPRAEILSRFGKRRRLVITFENGIPDLRLPYGEVVQEAENELWVEFDRDQVSAFDLIASLERDKGISDVAIKDENIESIVARLYQEGIEAAPQRAEAAAQKDTS